MVGHNQTRNEEALLKVNLGDVSLKDYMGLLRRATEDELTAIGANIALNQLRGAISDKG